MANATLPFRSRRHAMPHLRLVFDEPETDPPAPFPIRDWRNDRITAPLDAVTQVEQAFARVEQGLQSLSTQLDDLNPFPFPKRPDPDNGPFAA
jgi:hypothetical protein